MKYGALATERNNEASRNLDQMSCLEAATLMNKMDSEISHCIESQLPTIATIAEKVANSFMNGGRLIYLGAGTSGRLGVLDASECVPTFGVSENMVIGKIAGGDKALRYAVEGAEDDPLLGKKDLEELHITKDDVVIAVSASGTAAYCLGGLEYAKQLGAITVGITCVTNPKLEVACNYVVSAVTGPEVLMGSTRLRAGTATKMVLNMISTLSMVKIGKVYKNYMVDMIPSNKKLMDRAKRIVAGACEIDVDEAEKLLIASEGEMKTAIVIHEANVDVNTARKLLEKSNGFVRKAIELAKDF